MTKRSYNTGATGGPENPEGAGRGEPRVRIRAISPHGSRIRNGVRFGTDPVEFTADELKWTPDQWERARKDPCLLIEEI